MIKKSYSRVCNLCADRPLPPPSPSLSHRLSIIFQINWLAFVKQFPVRNSNCISKQQGQHARAASAKRQKGGGRGTGRERCSGNNIGILAYIFEICNSYAQTDGRAGVGGCEDSAG